MTKKQKRIALVASLFATAALAAALVLTALNSAVAYFYMPSDLAALADPPLGVIRLGGLVKPGSVRYDNDHASVRFVVTDETSEALVSYTGILPDLFREGQGVVVQGRADAVGRITATQVLAKHDENYMPKEIADALKESGRWREGGVVNP